MSLFSIIVDISASTAKFSSSIERVEKQLDHFGETVKRTLEFAGVAVGLHEVVASFDEFVEHAAHMEIAAQKTGLAVEELSRLEFAAKQSGVAIEQLETGVEKFAKTVAAAEVGTGKQADAFRAMGVSLEDSSGHLRPMNDLLLAVADKFASYKDSVEKTALAQILFGRAGAELIPVLNQGAEGIAELERRSDELGNTIDKKTAMAAHNFEQKLGELHAAGQGFWNLMAQQLLPTLTAVTTQFTSGVAGINKFEQEVQFLTTLLKVLVDVGYSVYRTFVDVGTAIGALAAMAVEAAKLNFKQAGDIWKKYNEDAKASEESANQFFQKLWSDTGNVIAKVADAATENSDKIAAPIVGAVNWADKMLEMYAELDKKSRETTTAMADHIDKSFKLMTDHVHIHFLDTSSFAETAAREIQSDFANFLFDPAAVGFKGLVKGFADALRRMIADAAAADVFKALFGRESGAGSTGGLGGILSGVLDKVFGGGFGGGSGAISPVSITQSYVGAYATGSDYVPRTGLALVHEGERITPASQNRGGDGVTFAPVYNIDARGATQDVIAALPEILRQNNEQLKAEIVVGFQRRKWALPR